MGGNSLSKNKSGGVASTFFLFCALAVSVVFCVQLLNKPNPDDQFEELPFEAWSSKDFSHGDIILFIGRTEPLANPCEGIHWASDDPQIANVDEDGNVTGLSVGDVTITAWNESGLFAARWLVKVRKTAYLTIDDRLNKNTDLILDALRDKGVKATFFLCMDKRSSVFYLYERIKNEGHAIGNHTANHSKKDLATEYFLKDLQRMDDFLESEHGISTRFMRFPGGSSGKGRSKNHTKKILLDDGWYTMVDWTATVGDSAKKTSYSSVMTNLKRTCKDDTEIILMHNTRVSAKALPDIIDYLREEGYEFARIDDAPQVFVFGKGWLDNKNMREREYLPDVF